MLMLFKMVQNCSDCLFYGYLWLFYGYLWLFYGYLMVIYGYFMVIYGYLMVIYGYFMVIYGYFMVIYGYFMVILWLFNGYLMVIYGYFMVIYGYFIVIYGYFMVICFSVCTTWTDSMLPPPVPSREWKAGSVPQSTPPQHGVNGGDLPHAGRPCLFIGELCEYPRGREWRRRVWRLKHSWWQRWPRWLKSEFVFLKGQSLVCSICSVSIR